MHEDRSGCQSDVEWIVEVDRTLMRSPEAQKANIFASLILNRAA